MLRMGQVDQDAFWASEVSYIKPGRTVHDYSISELLDRARLVMLSRESPFQYYSGHLLELNFASLRMMGEQAAHREIVIALVAGRIESYFYNQVPYPMREDAPISQAICRELASYAFDQSPSSFRLLPTGLELSIHAELADERLADDVAAAALARLRLDRPQLFSCSYDPVRAGDCSMKPSTDWNQPPDHEHDSAWARHIGVAL